MKRRSRDSHKMSSQRFRRTDSCTRTRTRSWSRSTGSYMTCSRSMDSRFHNRIRIPRPMLRPRSHPPPLRAYNVGERQIRMPLNFANIIALPLLLGVGVAFKSYFVMAWRSGQTKLLQSSLTRAVMFSAATTATAFGSLWLSSHPGTSSMGKLLALSLACTLAAAVLFQPALMGKPRTVTDDSQ